MSAETANPASRLDLLPTPQYVERLDVNVDLAGARPVRIVTPRNPSPKTALAARMLKDGLEGQVAALAGAVSVANAIDSNAVCIRLVEWPIGEGRGGELADIPINVLDEQALSIRHFGGVQDYVLRTVNAHAVVIVGPPQGLLYGAMTLIQLIESMGPQARIPGVYIRDFPAFEYRAASCWLLNAEANRWSYDRGQGPEAYETLCRRKLDFCLRHKINMVVFDGFGFGLAGRPAGYAAMMQRLNSYARERGIHLVFGGYGSGYGMAYQPGPLYEDAAYHGTAFLNRASYPDGATYACMGYPRTRAGIEPGIYGTCRSNEPLNRLKADELEAYVRAVEPGALYIHHEDFGGMDTTQKYWLRRCPQCRDRWPDDRASAADGAAGAIAHGYAGLIAAVNKVRNPETGYDAARDCVIILTSPVYMPSSPSSEDWGNALRLWQNVARNLPPADNLTCCFRETFPQRAGGTRWVDAFNTAMADAGRRLGLWIYFAGGADHWLNDYPFVGTPALNIMFDGAQGIYSASGDAYQEPQQLLNAEYSWNVRSDGFCIEPRTFDEAERVWRQLAGLDLKPAALFAPDGWLDRICRRLYGPVAGPIMRAHFAESDPLRPADAAATETTFDIVVGVSEDKPYLPMAYAKVFGVPVHWRRLALDSKTWPEQISNEIYAKRFEACGISRAELHARLRRQWDVVRSRAEQSVAIVERALAARLPDSTRDDLQFLQRSLEVTALLSQALMEFHEARRLHFDGGADSGRVALLLGRANAFATETAARARDYFPMEKVTDPDGAEVGAIHRGLEALLTAIERARIE